MGIPNKALAYHYIASPGELAEKLFHSPRLQKYMVFEASLLKHRYNREKIDLSLLETKKKYPSSMYHLSEC